MNQARPNPRGPYREGAMRAAGPRCRELAERTSNGTRVRLLWRQGTRQPWVEVREPDDWVLAIPVAPEHALDAFHHPYAYAGSHHLVLSAQSLTPCAQSLQAAKEEHRGQ